ncbi:MAG: murein hydrolase activator EnvC family protein [Gammaproteobacteria bacterium]
MTRILLVLLVLAGTATARAEAQSAAEVRQRLENIQEQIRLTRARHAAAQGEVGYLETELARLETRIGRVARRLRDTRRAVAAAQTRLETLDAREKIQLENLQAQRRALAVQVRAAYAMGRQEKLKLLLNQQDPQGVGRLLVYYDYINRARGRRIERTSRTLTTLAYLKQAIGAQHARLEDALDRLRQQQGRLRQTRSRRSKVLAALTRDVENTGRRLDALVKDEEGLQALLASIRQALADVRSSAEDKVAFESLKGRLPWPSAGPLVTDFGVHNTATEDVIWQGVLIGADWGAKVRAVAAGRVVFADWMRGFGLLVIVDHGGSYMSLYGHNQSLYKSVGDRVAAGELIGRVGDSGGRFDSGLYFEIRYQGTPLDPLAWCTDRG